ncbi:hypothetical protein NEOLEDRAFT_1155451 [Neolentinus lepideus HHB14362 ss-1]|uniref:E3 ubiquitin protein ligase n=1 Tax=Neolentinus lepideus HHB14362 ss-1 TaxID=1314782 RepID=A0A165THY0_9AGAM|nr:hypothetical protein NEOLEDRAFT_1155451 [Neolentinus lepideus HHB14362 ss-1]
MESRKRALLEDSDPIASKKRAVSNEYGSPTRVNGVATDADEPKENDELELFRKEAIFRRMKHYSRENERSQHRIAELERRRDACEAGLSAMQACWTQLIGTIRLLVSPEALPPASIDTEGLFDMSVHVDSDFAPALGKALQERMDATCALVASFVQIGYPADKALSGGDMYINCQKAQTECTALRSEMTIMRARLADAESEKEKYHSRLVAAENRLDRLSSRTVPKPESRPSVPPERERPKEELPPNDVKPNGTQHPSAEETDDWRDIAHMREKEIRRLEEEVRALKDAQVQHEIELKAPSEAQLVKNLLYQAVSTAYHRATWRKKDVERELEEGRKELQEVWTKLAEEHEKGIAQAAKVQQEYQALLAKRDADLVRLREQRDQQGAELSERKHRDSVKMAALAEYKNLAHTRSERIAALESEVKRLRSRIAAATGDEELVEFLFSDESVLDRTYVDELKARLEKSDTELKALQESLSSLSQDHPDVAQHIQSEAEARQQIAQLAKELERYQSIFGDFSSSPDLSSQLRSKEDELQKLKLQLKQQTQAESALYTELEKLSAAWEGLDKQVKNKVFDLSAMEEKLAKTLTDKAKLENKFYAAMRDKEAVENERKNLLREKDKNGKSVETLKEEADNLRQQVDAMQSLQVEHGKIVHEYAPKIARMNDELKEWEQRAEAERAKAKVAQAEYKEALDKHFAQQADWRRREEAVKKKEKEVERMHATVESKLRRVSESGSGTKGKEREREEELEDEVGKLMSVLKCSTCKQNMRNTVITKCMHTFCKSCVEARISTRQRKCPACNLPFGQADVQTVYFQ